jgi:hypothetical protein
MKSIFDLTSYNRNFSCMKKIFSLQGNQFMNPKWGKSKAILCFSHLNYHNKYLFQVKTKLQVQYFSSFGAFELQVECL